MSSKNTETASTIPEHWRSYEEKHVTSSFQAITELEGRRAFSMVSQNPCTNGVAMRLWKSDRCFEFETDAINLTSEGLSREDMFGFASAVQLLGGEHPLTLDRTKSVSHRISAHILEGRSYELSWEFNKSAPAYQRAVLPVGRDNEHDFRSYIDSKGMRIGSIYRGAGFIEVELSAGRFQLFVAEREKQNFLFVDSCAPMGLETFLRCCDTMLLALGFLTGYYAREERYLLQSLSNDRREISGVCYERLSDTIVSRTRVISHTWLKNVNGQERLWRLAPSAVSNLVQRCLDDDRLARTLRIVVKSNPLTIEEKAAVYCVALETIKSIIIERAGNRVKPIRDKKVAEGLILQFKQLVAALPPSILADREALLRKIDNINNPGNRRSFSQCFELLGIELTDRDEECLSSRDEFLHGNIPFDGSEDPEVEGDLPFMVAKLHFLVSALVMKFTGYSGPLLNNASTFNWKLKNKTHSENPVRYV